MNIALRGPGGARWAMTERGDAGLQQETSSLVIGPSSMHWDAGVLTFELDEITAPLPSRIRGRVRVIPHALADQAWHLDAAGRHRWAPIAPSARVDVQLRSPDVRWSGTGYLDSNQGSEPLEKNLERWSWSRAALRDGGTAVLYDVVGRDGGETALAIAFDREARARAFEPPQRASLRRSGWRIDRTTRSDDGIARVERSLQDAPFYARSVISSRVLGQLTTSVHESLDLSRFRAPIVQAMLPFRMPRSNRR